MSNPTIQLVTVILKVKKLPTVYQKVPKNLFSANAAIININIMDIEPKRKDSGTVIQKIAELLTKARIVIMLLSIFFKPFIRNKR